MKNTLILPLLILLFLIVSCSESPSIDATVSGYLALENIKKENLKNACDCTKAYVVMFKDIDELVESKSEGELMEHKNILCEKVRKMEHIGLYCQKNFNFQRVDKIEDCEAVTELKKMIKKAEKNQSRVVKCLDAEPACFPNVLKSR